MTVGKRDVSVILIDDNDDEREAVKWVLEGRDYKVYAFESAMDYMGFEPPPKPCIILLDLIMPIMNGSELLRILNSRGCIHPICILTGFANVERTRDVMKAGAHDVLIKPIDPQELLRNVHECAKIAHERFEHARRYDIADGRLSGLTKREREVFEHMAMGQSSKVIARNMDIAVRTVEAHRSKVMEKTGARCVADLVELGHIQKNPAPHLQRRAS